jgi:hypothetical protein
LEAIPSPERTLSMFFRKASPQSSSNLNMIKKMYMANPDQPFDAQLSQLEAIQNIHKQKSVALANSFIDVI